MCKVLGKEAYGTSKLRPADKKKPIKEISTTETKLLPCPFCGGEAILFRPGDSLDTDLPHWVTCAECEADGPHYKSVPDVIAGWNKRFIAN